jgi:hypothetical protein
VALEGVFDEGRFFLPAWSLWDGWTVGEESQASLLAYGWETAAERNGGGVSGTGVEPSSVLAKRGARARRVLWMHRFRFRVIAQAHEARHS